MMSCLGHSTAVSVVYACTNASYLYIRWSVGYLLTSGSTRQDVKSESKHLDGRMGSSKNKSIYRLNPCLSMFMSCISGGRVAGASFMVLSWNLPCLYLQWGDMGCMFIGLVIVVCL